MSEETSEGGTEADVDTGTTGDAVASDGGISITGDIQGNNPLDTWRDGLSDDIKNDPSLASFKDVEGLAKSYVHSQKMIGSEKMPTPRDDWDEATWNAFYEKAGRPDTADAYSSSEIDLPEGIEIDDAIKGFKDKFHELGLSEKQSRGLLDYYNTTISEEHGKAEEGRSSTLSEATDALKSEFGNDFELNIELARGALRKFGNDDLVEMLESTGLGNNPDLIRAFSNIGKMVSEDDARGGTSSMQLNGRTNAQSEIKGLTMDADFQTMLNNRGAPGHQEALERWSDLHNLAFSEESA